MEEAITKNSRKSGGGKPNIILYGTFLPLTKQILAKIIGYLSQYCQIQIFLLYKNDDKIDKKIRYQWLTNNLNGLTEIKITTLKLADWKLSKYQSSGNIIVNLDKFSEIDSQTFFQNPLKCYNYLPNSIRSYFHKKVLLIGTESTGKTTLAIKLARFYNTEYVPEIGRYISERVGDTMEMTADNYVEILLKHSLEFKTRNEAANKIIFADTDCIDTLFWYEVTFPKINQTIKNISLALRETYDTIIYLHPTNQWIADNIRQFGKNRHWHNQKLLQMIKKAYPNSPIYELSGSYNENYQKALSIVKKLLTP
ncbi:MAG: AAA family ATPase [Bifidobacteriaceae bacterium]|jgi:nicotinamide riboside kinase|nr:AAA family ATPase [Bifidobacteriaceae bacterium]